MRRIGGFCLVLAPLIATPVVGWAQVCAGAASFVDGNLRAQVGTSSGTGWRNYGVSLSLGRAHGAFVSGGVSRGTYKNADMTDLGFSGSVGYQVRLGPRVQLCPKVNASHATMTHNFGRTHYDFASSTLGVSSALGVTVWSSPGFDLVSSAELAYAVTSARAQVATGGIEQEMRGSARSGGLLLSPGLIVRKVLTVGPFVTLPVGRKDAQKVYGFSVAISFGPR